MIEIIEMGGMRRNEEERGIFKPLPALKIRQTPVTTEWLRPHKDEIISTAPSTLSGFSRIAPSRITTEQENFEEKKKEEKEKKQRLVFQTNLTRESKKKMNTH
jgi:hypothetical protein